MTELGGYAEYSKVQYGLTPIEYKIRRSYKRLTVSIALDPEEGVLVTAPKSVPRERIDSVILAKGHWIAKGLRSLSDRPPPAGSKEFVSGEGFLYLGRQYRLRLESGGVRPLELRNGFLSLPVPGTLTQSSAGSYARAALVDWYRARAAKYLPNRCRQWAKALDVTAKSLSLSEPATRWGSTSNDGAIRLNWRIVQAPKALIDYVIIHELCHLVHRDHSREFWAMLGRAISDYDRRKLQLKQIGGSLVW